MKLLVTSKSLSVRISLSILRVTGFWQPCELSSTESMIYQCYGVFVFILLLGIFLMIQTVELFRIWGNVPLMTALSFLLFTNLAQSFKFMTIIYNRKIIKGLIDDAEEVMNIKDDQEAKHIVQRCNRETAFLQIFYFCLTIVTVLGWASSAEKGCLPILGWYPYDVSTSPAYEITYVHQVFALMTAALLHVSKDTLVVALIAQCRCRLRLLRRSLSTLDKGLNIGLKHTISESQESILCQRIRACIKQHQDVLQAVNKLQTCFSFSTFAQFSVSLVIICVTAFQLASQVANLVRFFSMGTYLLNMMYQVFLYCYQGHNLTEESTEVAGGAYECAWFVYSCALRRDLLRLMLRTRRKAALSAGGFASLSLATFTAILKASYSFFTVLQQIEEKV